MLVQKIFILVRFLYFGPFSEEKMTDEGTKIRWAPLESNPDVFNTYLGKLGVTSDWVSFMGRITLLTHFVAIQ